MSNGVRADFASEIDLGFRYKRASDGGAEIVLAFVNRIGPHDRVDVVLGELVYQIESVVLGRARGLCLLF